MTPVGRWLGYMLAATLIIGSMAVAGWLESL